MWLRQPDNWSCWIIYSAEELHNPHYANMKNRLLSKGALSLFNTCEKTWKLCLFYKLKSERTIFFFWHHTDPQNWIVLGSRVWFQQTNVNTRTETYSVLMVTPAKFWTDDNVLCGGKRHDGKQEVEVTAYLA